MIDQIVFVLTVSPDIPSVLASFSVSMYDPMLVSQFVFFILYTMQTAYLCQTAYNF